MLPQLEVNPFIQRLNAAFVRVDAATYAAVPIKLYLLRINKHFSDG
ncbi:MAG: hypothetical protein OEY99_00900 [Aigarchaeota archaeon]|nr:hypothetical protein [Aigarchaeota archaeon]